VVCRSGREYGMENEAGHAVTGVDHALE
jgi:hypothetical protein